jgi:predicted alpha/beta hydrolase family esterase
MKNAIIIHGMPSKEEYFEVGRSSSSNNQWLPWLQAKLVKQNILAQTPEMPEAYNPKYEEWKKVFEQFEVNEETILVGHSCGGGFIIRWLSENKVKVGKVFLVAPWLDPEKYLNTGMFDFEIDPDFPSRAKKVVVMYSTDDEDYILDTIKILKEKTNGIDFQEFQDKGHFCIEDLGSEELPELLNLILE